MVHSGVRWRLRSRGGLWLPPRRVAVRIGRDDMDWRSYLAPAKGEMRSAGVIGNTIQRKIQTETLLAMTIAIAPIYFLAI
jgi:hypothetical protein